jgi:type VI secretion system protein ImpK
MQQEIADLVYPIFLRALRLRDRLEAGESPDFEVEHAALRGLLLTEAEARRLPAYAGEGRTAAAPAPPVGAWSQTMPQQGDGAAAGPQHPPGVRYLMACWLDEFFIGFTPWAERWQEKKLETALYGTNERAWKLWEQAGQAERRADADALEAFFLSVMLGFRGDLAREPAQLQAWAAAARARQGRLRPWRAPPEREPPAAVPPLRGRGRLRRAVLACGLLLLLLIPLVAFFIARQLGQ